MTNLVINGFHDGGGSNLPRLPELESKPRTKNGREIRDGVFIVAWIAYEEHCSQGFVPGARRDFQMAFRRANGAAMSAKLKTLWKEENQWLEVKKPSLPRHAYEYRLGPLALPEKRKWVELGTMLYHPDMGGYFALVL